MYVTAQQGWKGIILSLAQADADDLRNMDCAFGFAMSITEALLAYTVRTVRTLTKNSRERHRKRLRGITAILSGWLYSTKIIWRINYEQFI
jgi:hypothetical protein